MDKLTNSARLVLERHALLHGLLARSVARILGTRRFFPRGRNGPLRDASSWSSVRAGAGSIRPARTPAWRRCKSRSADCNCLRGRSVQKLDRTLTCSLVGSCISRDAAVGEPELDTLLSPSQTRYPGLGEQMPHIDSGTGLTDLKPRWWARRKFATVDFVAGQSTLNQSASISFNANAGKYLEIKWLKISRLGR